MKRLAVLSFAIAAVIAPIQVQAQTACVRFPEPPNPEAEVRYLLSHPGARVCPGPNAGQTTTFDPGDYGATARWNATQRLMCSMSGRVC
jgi:hypothetical protein